jgi:hypothetical protein
MRQVSGSNPKGFDVFLSPSRLGVHNLPKELGDHKNARRHNDVKNFHTGTPQTLDATAQNLVAMATWRPEFVHPCSRQMSGLYRQFHQDHFLSHTEQFITCYSPMSRQYMVLMMASLNQQQTSLFLHNFVNNFINNYYSDGYFPFLFRVAIPNAYVCITTCDLSL